MLRNTARVFGAWWTTRAVAAALAAKTHATETLAQRLQPDDRRGSAEWDRHHRTDTLGIRFEVHPSFPADLQSDSHGYAGSSVRQINTLIEDLDLDDGDPEFWDLGSGKGRAVLCAALTGRFRRCVGVELDPDLIRTARQNELQLSATAATTTPVTWIEASAVDVDLPGDCPLVVYMYDPFEGRLLETVLDRLANHQAETGTPVQIVYSAPFHADQFNAHSSLHLAQTTTLLPWYFTWMVYEVHPPD